MSLTTVQQQRFKSMIARAVRREPIPYIVGHASFLGRQFTVDPAVLIPRPETELMVQKAIDWCRANEHHGHKMHLVDVGTGSGCIAVSLAVSLPAARVEAVDISPAALKVARANALEYGVSERIKFHRGKLLEPIADSPDMVIANLPYISDHEWTSLDDGVKWYEPELALRGGPKGLDLITLLLEQAKVRMAPGGVIFLEIGWQQGNLVQEMASLLFEPDLVKILPDFAGNDRIVIIKRRD